LLQAVEKSLKSLNLFHGGVADKQAGKYSGGMKRRLSVAISLIGDPKVCFCFQPNLIIFFFNKKEDSSFRIL
jgi:ABC-type Na+ transport system ATPase subunit NatA